jgi:hypothetical protein
MFTQVITPTKKPVVIDIPDEYLGHRLNIMVTELDDLDVERYSLENMMKFLREHRVDLSNFKFDRDEAHER